MYAFSEGSGFSNFAFDRYEPMRISSIHIDHIIVRIYTSAAANKDTESIGEFIFYYDGAGRVNAGGTIFNLAGGIGGYYLFAAPFKDVMVAALGEAYNPSQAYYFSAQIIISETTEAFEEDSLISALHPNFWRELN